MTDKTRIPAAYFLILIAVPLFSGCEIINPPEPVPAYIHIPRFKVQVDTLNQGSNANGITDAWVYVNDNLQGIYELPATFPILLEGIQTISIRAGIKNNGTGNTRIYYPFYTPFTTTVDFKPNETDTILPIVSYKTGLKFPVLENFESGNTLRVNKDRSTVDTIYRLQDPSPVFEGKFSLLDDLPGTGIQNNEFETQNDFPLPGGGADIMFEMNFRTNIPFKVGFVLYNINGINHTIIYSEVVTMNPSNGAWKKIYIDLKEDVSYAIGNNPGINTFRIFFRTANYDPSVDPEVYLDNLKLLHFE